MPISFPKSDQVPAKNCLFLYQQCAIECNHIAKPSQVNIFPKGQLSTYKDVFLQKSAECNQIVKHRYVNIFPKGQPCACREFSFSSSTVCNRVQPHSKPQSGQYLSQKATKCLQRFFSFFNSV